MGKGRGCTGGLDLDLGGREGRLVGGDGVSEC